MKLRSFVRLVSGAVVLAGLAAVAPRDASADIFISERPDGTLSFTDKPGDTRYDQFIREAAGYYQLPEAFIRAIMKAESDFDPTALSVAGAQGLMQLMPETAAHMLVSDAWDPRENIFGGCRYLRVLANTFNGDLDLTIAAYNAGEGAVIRAGGIPHIAETQDYVVKVKSWYRRYRATADALEASVGSPGAD
ncbi:MAG: lytic transglycosylase domain-containing protein [Deltaproteobacteria bacterium]|nr:lytic transglycosylase domain-containing protein [Deltaproteobacteria bacterium]